jgi:hypothetical protein
MEYIIANKATMAKVEPTEHIVYLPVWNAETETYEDYAPFESNHPGNIHVCNCQNKKSLFMNMSQHKLHIKNKSHKLWVQHFEGPHSHEEFKRVASELVRIKRELAIAYGNIEKQTARAEKYKMKYEKIKVGERIMVNELD